MNRIRKGDQVLVITGKNKGQRGDVLRVEGDRVFVSNVNLVKRHTKANPQANQPAASSSVRLRSISLMCSCSTPPRTRVNASAPKRSLMGARFACSVLLARSWTRKEHKS